MHNTFDLLDSPKEYIEASALHILSAITGRFVYYPGILLLTKANLMITLASIPGRTRRSSLMSVDGPVYEGCYRDLLNKTRTIPPDDLDKLVADSILEEGSPEGIADGIIDYRKNLIEYPMKGPFENIFNVDFQSSEFGDVLKNMGKEGGYQRGTARLISKTYCGEGGKVSLSTRRKKEAARYIPKGIFSTMFAGMQTMGLYIDPYHVQEGLMRRIIFINGRATRRLPFWNLERKDRMELVEKCTAIMSANLDVILERYEDKVMNRYYGIPVIIHPAVVEALEKIDIERTKAVDSNETYNNLIRQSDVELVIKISTIHALDALSVTDDGLVVNMGHFRKAKDFFDGATANNKEVFDRIGLKNIPAESHREPLERVYTIIAENNGITRSELYRKINPPSADWLTDKINILIAQERVEAVTTMNSRNTPTLTYKTVVKQVAK